MKKKAKKKTRVIQGVSASEPLMELKEKPDPVVVVSMSSQIDELAKAVCEFQEKVIGVAKDKSGYLADYASLPEVLRVIKHPMYESGLSFLQFPVEPRMGAYISYLDETGNRYRVYEGMASLYSMLLHESGQYLASQYSMPIMPLSSASNDAQKFAATITYMRRYALLAILRLTADPDTDCTDLDTYE